MQEVNEKENKIQILGFTIVFIECLINLLLSTELPVEILYSFYH